MSADVSNSAPSLSDKAIAVLAFAAYHELTSGQAVTSVVRTDGAGRKADDAGVAELEGARLLAVSGNNLVFSQAGLALLAQTLQAMRSTVKAAVGGARAQSDGSALPIGQAREAS